MISGQMAPMCMKALANLSHSLQNFTLAMVQEEHLTTVYFTHQLVMETLCIGLIIHVLHVSIQFVKNQIQFPEMPEDPITPPRLLLPIWFQKKGKIQNLY